MEQKTNVMRLLDAAALPYRAYAYAAPDGALSGAEVARQLGQNPEHVFKTLVTAGASQKHYVFVIPVEEELNLKKAAVAVGEKKIEMLKSRELFPLTGYVHGGCSPIGMKKVFPTTVDETALLCDTILFSAGKIGAQVEMSPEDLKTIIDYQYADVTGKA